MLSVSVLYHGIAYNRNWKCANTQQWRDNRSNGTFHASLVGMNIDKITVEDNFIRSITI